MNKKEIKGKTTLLNERQAAKFLNLAVTTLRNWRNQRRGPAYLKLGRAVRYDLEDLKAYLASRRVGRGFELW